MSLFKIVVIAVLAYLFLNMFVAENKIQLIIGLFVLIFITLPTIFIIFFKKFIYKSPASVKIWKIIRVIYIISIIFYVSSWSLGMWHLNEVAKTQKTIDFINSKKITLDDVMGKNLPLEPDKKLNDSTIAGIDANKNYIRDDVELAIFKKYPDSAKIRAAELQYAQALQLELTKASNLEIWIIILQKKLYSEKCAEEIVMATNSTDNSFKKNREALAIMDNRTEEIKKLILNNNLRNKIQELEKNYSRYMAIYSSIPSNYCDIDYSLLPN